MRDDGGYLSLALEILAYWQECLSAENALSGTGVKRARKLDAPSFAYLGESDRKLIQDALVLECDAFLTCDIKLTRNANHVRRELGINILSPVQYWEMLKPWFALFY